MTISKHLFCNQSMKEIRAHLMLI